MEGSVGCEHLYPSHALGKQTCEESFCRTLQATFVSFSRELQCANYMEDKAQHYKGDYLGSRAFLKQCALGNGD